MTKCWHILLTSEAQVSANCKNHPILSAPQLEHACSFSVHQSHILIIFISSWKFRASIAIPIPFFPQLCTMLCSVLSRVQLFVTPWTVACQAPLSKIFSRQEYWLLLLLLSCFSHVWLCATPEMAAHQAPLSLGFSRQEHWSGLTFPSSMHESEKWKWSRSVMSNS